MDLFRRVLRWLFLLMGFVAGLMVTAAAVLAQRLIRPPRQRLWATPGDLGLAYESIHFPAQDGVRLSGWFVPAPAGSRRNGATIVLLHGWGWNRLGEAAEDMLASLTGSTPVDMLRLAFAMQQEGYHVLMFDWRNHGESAARPPMTFGREEAQDLLGALSYLDGRSDVDSSRIGVIGLSTGANVLLHTLPHTDKIRAAVAVQPVFAASFAQRFGIDMFGPLGKPIILLAELFYRAAGGSSLAEFKPDLAAMQAGQTPVLYIQGKGDAWGSPEDVAQIAAATPGARGPLYVDTTHHFEGYQYIVDNPKIAAAFFEQNFT